MDDKEKQEWMDSLFPVNGERWIKIQFVDQEKSFKAFFMPMNDEKCAPYVEERGYRTTALTFREEYTPQVAALMDLKSDLFGFLHGQVDEWVVEQVNSIINKRMDELKRHLIVTEVPETKKAP